MAQYRNKPVVIEAIQWDGGFDTLKAIQAMSSKPLPCQGSVLYVTTLEGTMMANLNDWIIKGVKGELYPCKPDIFESSYEKV